jgi:hypothetical protein
VLKYTNEGEAIEGHRILCTFEDRPSYGIEKTTGRQQITITGNPATASIDRIWKYKENQKEGH